MMGLVIVNKWAGVSQYFAEKLLGLPHSPETIAYVVGVLSKRHWSDNDFSNNSIAVAFQEAVVKRQFVEFQRIGDWVLLVDTMMPDHFNGFRDFVENVARMSYYQCFRLMGPQWHVYEELADDLPKLVARVRQRLV